MKRMLRKLKLKKMLPILTLILFGVSSTVLAVSDPAPPGGVPIESSLAVANVTSGDDKYHDSVNAKVGEVVKFHIWYHNPEPLSSDKIAKDVNVKISIPSGMKKTHTATSTVGGSNTNTETNIATVETQIETSLEYIPGTAYRRYNTGTAENQNWVTEKISDSVTAGGFVIPTLKPCWEFQEVIAVQARVKAPVFTVDKTVRKTGETTWKTNMEAKPGDKIEFQIAIKNISNVTLTKVLVQDSFPPKLEYVKGSAMMKTGKYPDGITISDNLVDGGTYIGDYVPGAAAYILFRAIVPEKLSEGCYDFKNVANVKSDQTDWVNNQANVKVCFVKVTEKVPSPPPEKVPPKEVTPKEVIPEKAPLPITGPMETAAMALGTFGLSGGAVTWIRSKRRFFDAFRK